MREKSYLMISLYYVMQASREALKVAGQGLKRKKLKGEFERDGDRDLQSSQMGLVY